MLGLRFCARAFSSCGERGPLFIAVRGALPIVASLVAEHRLQMRRLSSCGSRAQLLRGMWYLPRPGLEPVSPALAGGFSTTAPPGKPPKPCFFISILQLRKWGSARLNSLSRIHSQQATLLFLISGCLAWPHSFCWLPLPFGRVSAYFAQSWSLGLLLPSASDSIPCKAGITWTFLPLFYIFNLTLFSFFSCLFCSLSNLLILLLAPFKCSFFLSSSLLFFCPFFFLCAFFHPSL